MQITTPRIRFRRFKENNFDWLFALDANPEVMRYIRNGKPRSEQEVAQKLKEIIAYYEKNKDLGVFAALDINTDEFMGWFCIKHLDNTPDIEIGYRLLPQFWNKGLGSEGAKAMLDYGFALGIPKICAVAHPDNLASQGVMKRLGMNFIKKDIFYGAEVVYFEIDKTSYELQKK